MHASMRTKTLKVTVNYLCKGSRNGPSDRPPVVRVISSVSGSITLSTGVPQGCVLSPLLYIIYNHDCVAAHSSNSSVKFADGTVVFGLISKDELAYTKEMEIMEI